MSDSDTDSQYNPWDPESSGSYVESADSERPLYVTANFESMGFEVSQEEEESLEYLGIPDFLNPADLDIDSIECFFMNCVCAVVAMDGAIIESIQEALKEFIGVDVVYKLEQFGFENLETFLDSEMGRDIFIKERDEHDRPTYRATRGDVYKEFQDYVMERRAYHERRMTEEEKEQKRMVAKEKKERDIVIQRNKYEFLKLLRDCGGEVEDVPITRVAEEYQKVTLKTMDKKYWSQHYNSCKAVKAMKAHFSRDIVVVRDTPLDIMFKRSFGECKKEIVSELKRFGADTSLIEAEPEESDVFKAPDDAGFANFFSRSSTNPPKAHSSPGPSRPKAPRPKAPRSTAPPPMDVPTRALYRSLNEEDRKTFLANYQRSQQEKDESIEAELLAVKRVPRTPSTNGVAQKAVIEEKPEPAAPVKTPVQEEGESSSNKTSSSASESDSDGEPLVAATVPRNTNYSRLPGVQQTTVQVPSPPVPPAPVTVAQAPLTLEDMFKMNLIKICNK